MEKHESNAYLSPPCLSQRIYDVHCRSKIDELVVSSSTVLWNDTLLLRTYGKLSVNFLLYSNLLNHETTVDLL